MEAFKFVLIAITLVDADVYLHNPRGSNNRLDEDTRERKNANRLFDSQNNNRGGYNVGSLYYYAGSKLPIEWTNQHSCASPNNHCEVIIQYMCSTMLRDGSTTTTIPDNPMECEDYDCNMDTQYGMHENYDYYLKCKLRERNQGLFTADQDLNEKNRAKNTRQNPNGNRRGYECPEERDYYPYWHPSPWIDIAVLTGKASRCQYYRENSENVKGRYECYIPRDILIHNKDDILIPNNEEDCKDFEFPENAKNATKGEWRLSPSHNVPAPECRETEFSRDNHLGNGIGGYPLVFNWTLPDHIHERCALRIRYNISTQDYEAWDDVDAGNNKPGTDNDAADIDLSAKYGLPSESDAVDRGYVFKNNPQVKIFPQLANLKLQLAINTAQFGRTFQDRSHRFAIRSRPSDQQNVDIYNVNVRGKRGNIVQVYPGVEYDFVPNTLHIPVDDYVHFQWSGSNSNPNNNDGQGRKGSDRSNVVLQRVQAYPEGTGYAYEHTNKYGHWGRSYPEKASNTTFLGFSAIDIQHLALLSPGHVGGELSELDDAGTYFDLGPRKVTMTGVYHYLCTRNNNFSNRSQKGRIICDSVKAAYQSIGYNGGNITSPGGEATVIVDVGDFDTLQKLSLEVWPVDDAEVKMNSIGKESPVGDEFASPFIILHPEQQLTVEEKSFSMLLNVKIGSTDNVEIYRTSTNFATWTSVDADVSDSVASFQAQEGGVYVAVKTNNVAVIVGATVACVVLVAVVVSATVFYFRKNPEKRRRMTRCCQDKI